MTTETLTPKAVPALRAGDRLTRPEFETRYAAMPPGTRAELIEGVVYIMPSPVSTKDHGGPLFRLGTWLGLYEASTPGVEGASDATVRLDLDNEPQPDLFLRILPECGGQSRTEDGYVEGAPELVCEVCASSASYDLHDKLNAYRRNGVREYLVWRVLDRAVDWFVLHEGRFQRLEPTPPGTCRSEVSLACGSTRRLSSLATHRRSSAPCRRGWLQRSMRASWPGFGVSSAGRARRGLGALRAL